MTREKQLSPGAAHVLRAILDHELRSRPRARCLVATPHGIGLRRDTGDSDDDATTTPRARN